ncbi:hypothetical protein LJB98_00485 [Bacteroidales bacterium OttesenSCG-928-M11]|nr:hypothetical protein [Bacteroidales bacterium OttesenSCG-928-M11]
MEKNKKSEAEQLKDLFNFLLKRWPYFVVSFIVCAVIGGVYYKAAPRIMGINASVNLRQNESLTGAAGVSQAKSLMSSFGLGGGGSENILDEALKMNSQGHIREVVKNLGLNTMYTSSKCFNTIQYNLYDRTPIVLKPEAILADTLNQVVRFTIDLSGQKKKIVMKAGKYAVGSFETTSFPFTIETAWGKYTFKESEHPDCAKPKKMKILFSNYDYTAQEYRRQLTIDAEKKTSNIIHLSLASDNIYQAKEIISEVVDVYNEIYDADRDLVTKKTLEFLKVRLEETETALEDADMKIFKFKNHYNLTEVDADVTYYFSLAGQIEAQMIEAESQVQVIKLMADFVSNKNNKYSLIPYLVSGSDPALAAVISAYNEQLMNWNESQRSNSQSSIVKSLENQIELQRENLIVTLNNAKKATEERLLALKKKETEFNTKLGKIPNVEKDYVSLRREQEIQQSMYIFLLEMKEQVEVKGVGLLPKLKVVEPPYVLNNRLSPSIVSYGIMITIIGGLLIPIFLIYFIPLVKAIFRKKKE